MNGDFFLNIPPDRNWNSAWHLFWNNPQAQARLNKHQPCKVFSCWNGPANFTSKALEKVKFRRMHDKECHQGEPSLFCKDMWHHGYGKIAVVLSVDLEYSEKATSRLKEQNSESIACYC